MNKKREKLDCIFNFWFLSFPGVQMHSWSWTLCKVLNVCNIYISILHICIILIYINIYVYMVATEKYLKLYIIYIF